MRVGSPSGEVKSLLARHGLRPKKKWGQNFLVDESALDRIVRAADLGPDDVVVEIGAGLGTLTAALAAAGPRQVEAVERDPDLVGILCAEFPPGGRVEVRARDALSLDFGEESRAAGRPLVVVGNLPYQITSPLVFAVLAAGSAIARAVFMVQREFADRLRALPGGKTRSRLSVMAQQAADIRLLCHVPAGAFHPRPEVTSSVVLLVPRARPLAPVRVAATFETVVRASFGARRKMLRRALGSAFGNRVAAAALAAAGVDGARRAETLEVADFARIADALPVGAGARGGQDTRGA